VRTSGHQAAHQAGWQGLLCRREASGVSAWDVPLLSYLRTRGGVLVGGQRAMAGALSWSKTRLNEVLHELEAGGPVQLDTWPTGTVVRLVPVAA